MDLTPIAVEYLKDKGIVSGFELIIHLREMSGMRSNVIKPRIMVMAKLGHIEELPDYKFKLPQE